MSDAYAILGLPRDASLQDIKRAYARALKANRPDEDAAAFARVHEAFEACVARRKALDAGEPDWDDEDIEVLIEEGAFEHDAFEPDAFEHDAAGNDAMHAGAYAGDDATPDEDGERLFLPVGPPDEVGRMVEAILAEARARPVKEFVAWLWQDERLYDLGFKQEVGGRIVHVAAHEDDLPWETLAAVYAFFEVDSIADRRLRDDYWAREAWLRTQADVRFHRGLRTRRERQLDFAEGIVLAELFDPPDRGRWWRMHLVPTLPSQLRREYETLGAQDPARTDAALSERAREYWLPFTDPTRLPWRRVAVAVGHALAISLPLAALVSSGDMRADKLLGAWGVVAGVLFGVWMLRQVWQLGTARYSAWRLRTVGTGEAPVGANPLADRITMFSGGGAVVALLLAVLVLRFGDKGSTGTLLQVWMLMVMWLPLARHGLPRWEAAVAAVAGCVAAYPWLAALPPGQFEATFMAAAPGAAGAAVLAVVLVDIVHARQSRQALADVRDAFSIPQCVLAACAVLAAWLVRPG